MTEPSNTKRQFSIWELMAYVSSFAVVFGLWGLSESVESLRLIGISILFLLLTLIGVGTGVMFGGRRWIMVGAVSGFLLAVLLFVALSITVLLTHS